MVPSNHGNAQPCLFISFFWGKNFFGKEVWRQIPPYQVRRAVSCVETPHFEGKILSDSQKILRFKFTKIEFMFYYAAKFWPRTKLSEFSWLPQGCFDYRNAQPCRPHNFVPWAQSTLFSDGILGPHTRNHQVRAPVPCGRRIFEGPTKYSQSPEAQFETSAKHRYLSIHNRGYKIKSYSFYPTTR